MLKPEFNKIIILIFSIHAELFEINMLNHFLNTLKMREHKKREMVQYHRFDGLAINNLKSASLQIFPVNLEIVDKRKF